MAPDSASGSQILWIPTTTGRVAYQVDPLILREAMIRAGKRQVDIATEAGVSRQMVCDIVSGRRQPSEKSLMAIAKLLDLDPRALLRRAPSASHNADIQHKETTAA